MCDADMATWMLLGMQIEAKVGDDNGQLQTRCLEEGERRE